MAFSNLSRKLELLPRYLAVGSGLLEILEPTFFIIGAQKSGTTSLYRYIKRYAANFSPPLRKEIHYYDYLYYKGSSWYRAHYPYRNRDNETYKTGEASPYYIFHPLAPGRIKKDYPNARFVVLLRNPIDRAYSHYQFQIANNLGPNEPLSFKEAIKVEEERLDGEIAKLKKSDTYRGEKYQYFSYLARGRYAEQLRRWFACFDREQFRIVPSGTFFQDTKQELDDIFEFLGLEWINQPFSFDIHNTTDYQEMESETREWLRQYFEPFNRELFELIGREFNWT